MSDNTAKLISAGVVMALSAATYNHHKMTTDEVAPPPWANNLKASVLKRSCSLSDLTTKQQFNISGFGTDLPNGLHAWRSEYRCVVAAPDGVTCQYNSSNKIRSCWVKKQDKNAPQW